MNPAKTILLAAAMLAALSADAAYRKGELLWKCDFTPEEAAKYGVDGHRGGGIVYLPMDGRSGDGAMIRFILATKGRKRGYGETAPQELDDAEDNDLTIEIVDGGDDEN